MTEWEKFERMVNLKSEVVELALLDELRGQMKSVQSNISALLTSEKELIEKAKKVKSFADIVDEQSKRLMQMAEELSNKTKDLGLPEPKEVDFYITQASDFIATAKELRNKATI